MKDKVILSIETDTSENTYLEFSRLMGEAGLTERYQLSLITNPAGVFVFDVMDLAADVGLSSLLNLTVSMEDITSPSHDFDFVLDTVLKFVNKLLPAKKLLIIDPYFYADSKLSTLEVLRNLMLPFAGGVEELCIIHDGDRAKGAVDIRKVICSAIPGVKITEIPSKEFHDRFWLNPEVKSGVVFGTSLNGIGKKISLVDRLRKSDVEDLLCLASDVGYRHQV